MKIRYKYSEPEIVLMPNVYAMFLHISKNIKTNLIWTCLVRKRGNLYILEDLYFPPQNVNEFMMCNFSEDFVAGITASTFMSDFRECRFNMIGKFVMSKSVEITDSVFKEFEKLMHPSLDESLMMQLNSDMEMSFALSRRATFLSDLNFSTDLSDIINESDFSNMLKEKIGSYRFDDERYKNMKHPLTARKIDGDEDQKDAVVIKSTLLIEKTKWYTIV